MIYRFADLQLDTGRRLLTRNGRAVKLTKLCFEVLKVLVEAAPDLVSHDELIDRVWGPNRVVTPENLAQRIHILRESLGDAADNPTYIEGVRGQGFRLIPKVEVDALRPETASRSKYRSWLPAGIAIAVVGIAIAWVAWVQIGEPLDGPDPQSIAVLPFKNIGGDPGNEYMSDGIAEELMNALAQVPQLRVTAQTSSFAFKDQAVDIRTIAQELGVAHVLEGSVRVSGDKLRITAQLIESKDGTHEWSETYDRELQDVFAIQDDITQNVVSALATTLGVTLEAPIPSGSTRNLEAYTAYLLGRRYLVDREVDALAKAVSQFALAIELDPDYAAATAGLVEACIAYYYSSAGRIAPECPSWDPEPIDSWDEVPRYERYSRQLEPLARKAVTLDPMLGEAWIALGSTLSDPALVDEAGAAYFRGLELNPSLSDAYAAVADFLRYRPNLTIDEEVKACEDRSWSTIIEKGLSIDPLSLKLREMATLPMFADSADTAMAHARKIVEIAPDALVSWTTLGNAVMQYEGRVDEALRWYNRAAGLGWERWLSGSLTQSPILLEEYDVALADIATAIKLVEDTNAQAQRAGDRWAFGDVSFLTIFEGAAHLYAGHYEEAEAVFESLQFDNDTHPYHRRRARLYLVGLELARGGPQAAIDRWRDIESSFGLEPEDSCFAEDPGGETDHCPWFLVPLVSENDPPEWAVSAMQDARDSLDLGSGDCSLSFNPWRLRLMATVGRTEEAVQYLVDAVADGWRAAPNVNPTKAWQWIAYYSPELHGIRSDPRFQAAVAVIEKDIAEQRANVQAMRQSGEILPMSQLYPQKPDGL